MGTCWQVPGGSSEKRGSLLRHMPRALHSPPAHLAGCHQTGGTDPVVKGPLGASLQTHTGTHTDTHMHIYTHTHAHTETMWGSRELPAASLHPNPCKALAVSWASWARTKPLLGLQAGREPRAARGSLGPLLDHFALVLWQHRRSELPVIVIQCHLILVCISRQRKLGFFL